MQWAISYFGSTFALILVVTLAVLALGAVAWFAKNWKVAIAAVAILAVGFAYMQIDKNAYQRRVSEEAAAKVATLEGRLTTMKRIGDADAKRAFEDMVRIEELEKLANATPPNTDKSIPADVSKRIGAIR